MTQVLIGDTRSFKNIARLKELGWGRMFAGVKPTPYEGEPWGFDNGAFYNWQHGMPFDEQRFLYRTKIAAEIGKPFLAVVPDIVAAGCSSLLFSLNWVHRLTTGTEGFDLGVALWPWYLAVQDGMTIHDVKPYLGLFAGILLGGSDTFKTQA